MLQNIIIGNKEVTLQLSEMKGYGNPDSDITRVISSVLEVSTNIILTIFRKWLWNQDFSPLPWACKDVAGDLRSSVVGMYILANWWFTGRDDDDRPSMYRTWVIRQVPHTSRSYISWPLDQGINQLYDQVDIIPLTLIYLVAVRRETQSSWWLVTTVQKIQ